MTVFFASSNESQGTGNSQFPNIDISNPIHIDEYETDLEGELVEKQRETYTQLSAYDQYKDLCKQYRCVPVSLFIKQMATDEIDLKYHSIGPLGIKCLSAPLTINTTVTRLNLTENFCGAEGCQDLAEMLCENCYITDLILTGNSICETAEALGAKALATIIKENSYISNLVISQNYLGDTTAEIIQEALKVNLKLKQLDLSNNEFGDDGGTFLGFGIAGNDSIEEISLNYNKIRGKGAISLAAALRVNISLKHFDLGWNGFGDEGAFAIAESLKVNNSLLSLKLDMNRITDVGMEKLASAIGQNDTLRSLSVGQNPITSKGVISILDAVEANPKSMLDSFDVAGLVADDALLDRLESFTANWNRSRTQLNVDCFEVSGLTIFNRRARREREEAAKLAAELAEQQQGLRDEQLGED